MMLAYVLITAAIGKVQAVIKELKKIPGVKSAHVVTGPYDIIAFVETKDLASLSNTVIKGIHGIKGVVDTNTAIVVEL
ncbi:MAG: Lrp/AsnC family transcriptional regulator [Hadesarchaea archaeon]|nr:MAG: Lrp/AsnC family transcriptional regulator [Hadesarchaea archaeon]